MRRPEDEESRGDEGEERENKCHESSISRKPMEPSRTEASCSSVVSVSTLLKKKRKELQLPAFRQSSQTPEVNGEAERRPR